MNQAFPLRFCILEVIKNWMVERPGNEAKQILHVGDHTCAGNAVIWSSYYSYMGATFHTQFHELEGDSAVCVQSSCMII